MSLQLFLHNYWSTWFINPIRRWCHWGKNNLIVPDIHELRSKRLEALSAKIEKDKNTVSAKKHTTPTAIGDNVRKRIRNRKFRRYNKVSERSRELKPGEGSYILHIF